MQINDIPARPDFPSIFQRYEAKHMPEPNSGCWIWFAGNVEGYGLLRIDREMVRAPRLAWVIHRGPIPDGIDVLHHCDMPCCVNPDHLFLGDDMANSADKVRKGRSNFGEKHPLAKLTTEDALSIIASSEKNKDLAAHYGVHEQHIYAIRAGKKWAHLKETANV